MIPNNLARGLKKLRLMRAFGPRNRSLFKKKTCSKKKLAQYSNWVHPTEEVQESKDLVERRLKKKLRVVRFQLMCFVRGTGFGLIMNDDGQTLFLISDRSLSAIVTIEPANTHVHNMSIKPNIFSFTADFTEHTTNIHRQI